MDAVSARIRADVHDALIDRDTNKPEMPIDVLVVNTLIYEHLLKCGRHSTARTFLQESGLLEAGFRDGDTSCINEIILGYCGRHPRGYDEKRTTDSFLLCAVKEKMNS
eukprot:PhF_6_TR14514/c0_g2_i1/m.23053